MIDRVSHTTVHERLATYPAVALVGPRQCGKTTLAQSLGGSYYDLEQEPDRLRLDLDWERVTRGSELVILDEAQAWPDIFPRLRGAIDTDRARMGRFLLLGSVSPALMVQVSESLAGRLSIVELSPFLWPELASYTSLDTLWMCGGFPDGSPLFPSRYPRWQLDHLTLIAQRDLPSWGLTAGPQTTTRLMRMLAAVHGQAWNASKLGQSLGVSYHTVNRFVDFFEGAFLTRRLQPFTANLSKRLTKRPKVYWRDSGLLHALLNVPDRDGLLAQPWVGASWEGFVIEQAIGLLSATGRPFEAFYFRTSDRYELDLVLDLQGERWAIEVKLTSAPGPDDLQRLDRAADLIDADRRFLVSQTANPSGDEHRASLDLPGLLERLRGAG